jgi:catechol 2,3-dioxygenase-like lactoylglutathione lyase family enzyme
MAHYSFRKDLEDSKKGVGVAASYFAKKYNAAIRELPKAEQGNGDFEVEADKDICGPFFVEVKYDLMAAKTGNLCFEVDNGKKATGILATAAQRIVYAIPQVGGHRLFIFRTPDLLTYLSNPTQAGKFRFVRGGDGKRFGMLLVPLATIEADKVAEEIIECAS